MTEDENENTPKRFRMTSDDAAAAAITTTAPLSAGDTFEILRDEAGVGMVDGAGEGDGEEEEEGDFIDCISEPPLSINTPRLVTHITIMLLALSSSNYVKVTLFILKIL